MLLYIHDSRGSKYLRLLGSNLSEVLMSQKRGKSGKIKKVERKEEFDFDAF